MKTIEQQIAVMQHFANGGEVEANFTGKTWVTINSAVWDWASYDYRIKEVADPYAELKAAAADPTKQIRVKGHPWVDGGYRPDHWSWCHPVDQYEIRDKPRTVKLLAWLRTDGFLTWRTTERHLPPSRDWRRVPSEDKTVEVES